MKLKFRHLNSEDVTNARRAVDRVYKIRKEGLPFTKSNFGEALQKASRRIEKAKPSPKQSKT